MKDETNIDRVDLFAIFELWQNKNSRIFLNDYAFETKFEVVLNDHLLETNFLNRFFLTIHDLGNKPNS